MKLSMLFICSLTAISTNAQLLGTFCNTRAYESECIELLEENRFKFKYWSCTGKLTGEGNYTLKKKRLILVFDKDTTPPIIDSFLEFKVISSARDDSDKLSIDVLVLSKKDSLPIPFVNVVYYENDVQLNGCSTDLNGKCQLSILPSDKSGMVSIGSGIYNKVSIPIDLYQNYRIQVALNILPFDTVIYNKVWNWKVSKINDASFKVKIKRFPDLLFEKNQE